jgi:hypothetical protein
VPVRHVRGERRRRGLPFLHPLRQPLDPLADRLAAFLPADVQDVGPELPPRDFDRTAEEVVDEIEIG